jgi:hypothetical protein
MKSFLIGVFAGTLILSGNYAIAQGKCEVSCDPQYLKADAELNYIWKNLPDGIKDILRQEQRNWIKQRDKQCGKDPKCLTTLTQNRTEYLKTYRPGKAYSDEQADCLNGGGGISCFDR